MGVQGLQIRLFGAIAVLRDGEPAELPQSKKTRALLAYLALNKGAHRRERLCELFWEIPDDPRGSLRWSLSKLRGVVNNHAQECIKADRNTVSLDGVEVDFLTMQRLSENLGDVSTERIRAIVDKFKSGILDDLALPAQEQYETWRLSQQEQARRVHCVLLTELAGRHDDDPSAQADLLYELVRIEPYAIELHLRLVAALARAGRKNEAERQTELSRKELAGVEGFDPQTLEDAVAKTEAAAPHPTDSAASESAKRQVIRFCKTTDGVQIAYATAGDGSPLVKTANWLNHLEFDWESPVWRHVFLALTKNRRLIRYDARGNGLSDWNVTDFSIERQVEDLEAVVEAAGLENFPLLGISQGCAISILYAVRNPDKVSKLILLGGYARGWRVGVSKRYTQQTEAMVTLVRSGWGQDNPVFRQMFASLFMPSAPAENHDWFNELQRITTSPANAARLIEALGTVDVRSSLQHVKAPTLIIHARGDMRVPIESGKEIAVGIPDARFMALETDNHIIPECDPAWPRFIQAVYSFLEE